MKLHDLFVCTTLALALTAGCSKKKDPAEETVSMLEDLGNAAEAAKGDCGKMATGLQSVVDKYKGDFDAMKAAGEKANGDKDAQKALEAKYGARVQKALPKLFAMASCADDPKVQAVTQELSGLGLMGKKGKAHPRR